MFLNQSGKHTLSLLGEPPKRVPQVRHSFVPRLDLLRADRRRNFTENLAVFFTGPPPPKKFLGSPYFRDCWVHGSLPDRAFLASTLWHAAFVLLLVQIWPLLPSPPRIARPQVEISFYGPIDDLPTILPARPVAKPAAPGEPAKAREPRGADAYHPRQTILNAPLQPNHPRQTLIQPAAPPEPPKILPALPNIVTWNGPAKPKLQIDPAALAPLRPNAPAPRQEQAVAPELANQEKLAGAVNIAGLNAASKPALPVTPMSAPNAVARQSVNQAAPQPDIPGAPDQNGAQLIALSAAPAPEMPPVIPEGNLASRVAISPEGKTPGAPGGSSPGAAPANAKGAGEGSGTGPPGLSISGGGKSVSTYSALGPANPGALRTPVMPGTVAAAPPPASTPAPAGVGTRSPALVAALKPGVNPETLLGPKRVYTLHINMPNVTSATGSWILTFAEMAPVELPLGARPDPAALAGPEPLRKVDPKYPPELRSKRVEGEVVLYAVIRKDGTVDSIQLVQGIDPVLDENAMQAMAQWKFRAGERDGAPIDLEAIVHIPFHAVAPLY